MTPIEMLKDVIPTIDDVARCCKGKETKEWTKRILESIASLGRSKGYVPAYTGWGGWIFDLCWLDYVDWDKRILKNIVLALESEWQTDDVNLFVDFNKLVHVKSSLSVMIFQEAETKSFQKIYDSFVEAIRLLETRDERNFLFSCYVFETEKFAHRFITYRDGVPVEAADLSSL